MGSSEGAREEPEEPGDEAIYDLYLDAATQGRVEEPAAFLARHGAAGDALRERLGALHRMLAEEAPARADRPPGGPPAVPAPRAEGGLPFERLGEFRLLRRLDAGGMGTVYLAEQESLSRTVALKVIRPELQGSAHAAERFRREALSLARLRHENVVAIHAVGEDRGVRFIAMEYVPGRGLDELLADASARGVRVRATDAIRWCARIARALHAAHEAGIVHRDVKPSNIRITPEGKPLLVDFGIARETGAETMTASAPFVGSPAYAAPEQIAGVAGAADGRSDVYSLGVTLYECLAGRAPWRAETLEQVFRAILTDEAPRLRRLDATIARDVEVVVAKAMEKEPSRRYATAAELADDLDALLESRPVRARPPGMASRLVQWSKRRPGRAAAAATVTASLAGLVVLLSAQAASAARERRQRAADAVAAARARIAAYRDHRAASKAAEEDVDLLHADQMRRHFEKADVRKLDEKEDVAAASRRDREALFHEVLDLVRQAESLDPGVEGAGRVRAELYLEKWREAVDAMDSGAAGYYREKLLASSPDADLAHEVTGTAVIDVASDPPGAEVHLFRYVEQFELSPGGDRRLVPVPVGGTPAVLPGTWSLEVTEPSGDLRRGDLVVGIGGAGIEALGAAAARECAARGAPARVVRDGRVFDAVVPPGTAVRVTATPLLSSPANRLGTTPVAGVALSPGDYLFLLRREGFEDLRMPRTVNRTPPAPVAARLLPEGTTPRGFVRIANGEPDGTSLWIMEREVTAREYLEFLNDPATLREIEASPAPIRVPRSLEGLSPGGVWPRREGGGFELPPPWTADWPVLGVSLEDARAYAAWRTARARAEGRGVEYAVPSYGEWLAAAIGPGMWRFVHGNRFRPHWAKTCFARRQAMPEPVVSYPVDESVAGVFDLTGSAVEWCEGWYDQGRGFHRLAGGSWALAEPDQIAVYSPRGGQSDWTNDETGFRLVVRRPAAGR